MGDDEADLGTIGMDDNLSEKLKGGHLNSSEKAELEGIMQSFLRDLNMFAKSKYWTFDSILALVNLIFLQKQHRSHGNVWNAFQSFFLQEHPNPDPTNIPISKYTSMMVKPAYKALVKSHSGKDAPEWMSYICNLVFQHEEKKLEFTEGLSSSSGQVQK